MGPLVDVVARLRAAGCVYAEDEADVLRAAAVTPAELAALVTRRVAGEPLEQVVGWASFGGLRIALEPGVFVPRRRTEFLVRLAAAQAPPRAVVLDLCAGSGALGAALAASAARLQRPVELHAADLDPVAVRCLRRNVPAGTSVYAGDLYAPLPDSLRGRVNVLLANAPYVPSHEIAYLPVEAREHEPASALDGGSDGLDVHRRIVAGAGEWLAPGGCLLIEVSDRQVDTALALFAAHGLAAWVEADDDLGATVVVGRAHDAASGTTNRTVGT